MSIREKLEGLQAINQIDLEVLELKKSGMNFPKRVTELDEEVSTSRSRLDAEKVRLDEAEAERTQREASLQAEREKIKKWEERLVEQRSTREYTALAREIDIAKRSIAVQEQTLKDLSSDLLVARQKFADGQAAQTSLARKVTSEKGKIKKQVEEIDAQLAALADRRAELSQKIDGALFTRYELACRNTGSGLAAVGTGGTCRGCNMRIRPQLHNVLRAEVIETCPSCHRLIYAAELLDPPPAVEIVPEKIEKPKRTRKAAKS